MTPEERAMLFEAAELAMREDPDALVIDIAESGMAREVCADAAALAGLFESQGRAAASSRLLDLAVLGDVGGGLARLVLPLPGMIDPPGAVRGSVMLLDGVVLGGREILEPLVVGTDSEDLFEVDSGALTSLEPAPWDASGGVVRVRAEVPLAQCSSHPSSLDWNGVVTRAARCIAHELVGIGRGARELATEHVTQRRQFGRPLGTLQAVRHRLADVRVAEVGATALLQATGEDAGAKLHTDLIKPVAGRAALTAVAAAQQLCGAMGFTAEFGLDRWVRRAYLLDSLLGGGEEAAYRLGSDALTGVSPPLRLGALA
jgi:acyl-CoA dehydrogenase-like protein